MTSLGCSKSVLGESIDASVYTRGVVHATARGEIRDEINLFVLDLPRLSVDADLNYVGAPDRDVMPEERSKMKTAVRDATSRLLSESS